MANWIYNLHGRMCANCVLSQRVAQVAQVARIKIPSALCNQHTYPHTYRVFLSDEKLDVSSLQIDFVCYSVSFTLCHLSPTLLINVTHGTQETPLATPRLTFYFTIFHQKYILSLHKKRSNRICSLNLRSTFELL